MQTFKIHTLETAPEKSKPPLQALNQAFGLIPNLAATMAESPVLVGGYVTLFGMFASGSFSGAEREVLLLTNAVTNKSAWPVAFHSGGALKEGVSKGDVYSIREGRLPDDARYAALSKLTKTLIETRGHLEAKALASFIDAGFSPAQAFEVLAGIAISTMANYASNIAKPPLDDVFKPQMWVAT